MQHYYNLVKFNKALHVSAYTKADPHTQLKPFLTDILQGFTKHVMQQLLIVSLL